VTVKGVLYRVKSVVPTKPLDGLYVAAITHRSQSDAGQPRAVVDQNSTCPAVTHVAAVL
jgi:hypothetical protein